MEQAYIYCFSNQSMPNIFNIGLTIESPIEHLTHINEAHDQNLPTAYSFEFAKKVNNPEAKKEALYQLLTKYGTRVHPQKTFFRSTIEDIKALFDLMDGNYFVRSIQRPIRDMSLCFTNGQRIRHNSGVNIWIGIYDANINKIIYDNASYTINKFVESHYRITRPDRTYSANSWRECECEIDGNWILTYDLEPINA